MKNGFSVKTTCRGIGFGHDALLSWSGFQSVEVGATSFERYRSESHAVEVDQFHGDAVRRFAPKDVAARIVFVPVASFVQAGGGFGDGAQGFLFRFRLHSNQVAEVVRQSGTARNVVAVAQCKAGAGLAVAQRFGRTDAVSTQCAGIFERALCLR